MKLNTPTLLIVLAAFWLCPGNSRGESKAEHSGAAHEVIIKNTTVIDGTGAGPLERVNILIRGDRIVSLGSQVNAQDDAEVIDGTGKFVIPGLIDVHVHLQFPVVFQLTPEQKEIVISHTPKAFLYNGVTTVLNVSAPNDWILPLREAQRAGRLTAPRIYALGESFKPEDGWGSRHGGALKNPEEARKMALGHVAAGVDGFKLIIEDGLGSQRTHVEISEDMLQAIVDIAREHDIPLYSHAINLHEYHRAADIRSKAIIHGLEDPIPEDDSLLQKLVDYDIAVVPTVSLFESFLRPDPRAGFDLEDPVLEGTLPDFLLKNMRSSAYMEEERRRFSQASHIDAYTWVKSRIPVFRANVTKMHEAGVKIAVGTDGGGTVGYNFQGYNTPWEVKILVESGFTPLEAIVAATRNGAEVIGILDELGTIEPGKLADLLILKANPLADIENIRQIEWVLQDGEPNRREAFAYPK
jgi:imidazolonepropionase-like amidohydrolase